MPRAPTYISLVANLCISDIYPISVLSRHRPAMTFRRKISSNLDLKRFHISDLARCTLRCPT